MIKKILTITGLSLLLPQISSAHSFGQLYNLPVPFWMYLYGGAGAMLVSFLFIGYFFSKKSDDLSYSRIDLSRSGSLKYLTSGRFLGILKYASLFLFLLVILTGAIGENSPYVNFNMTFFWIIFALGLTYATAFIGNIYSAINPLKMLAGWFVGKKDEPLAEYPKSFGYYPSLVFFFLFIWLELIGGTTPFKLSFVLIGYAVLNNIGAAVWGKEIWFKYCEFFSVFFRLIGKISPIEYSGGKLFFRAPFVGLLKEHAEHASLLMFALFMLSSTAFDGFKETFPWTRFYWGSIDGYARPIFGASSYPIFETLGLLVSPFVFLAIYLFLIYLAKIIAKSPLSLKELSLRFAFSLIPIALVYSAAHYYTLIFSEGLNIISLASDPFGFGWNLFGTAGSSWGMIIGANFAWHSQVALILLGHIASVYLTHRVALNVFPNNKRALLSQLPMLILMVAYTIIGLWILSQPITG